MLYCILPTPHSEDNDPVYKCPPQVGCGSMYIYCVSLIKPTESFYNNSVQWLHVTLISQKNPKSEFSYFRNPIFNIDQNFNWMNKRHGWPTICIYEWIYSAMGFPAYNYNALDLRGASSLVFLLFEPEPYSQFNKATDLKVVPEHILG